MDSNIKIMRFLTIAAIVSLIITYVAYLNVELRFCVLNSSLVSNNLIFTMFSGAFASIITALLLEIR